MMAAFKRVAFRMACRRFKGSTLLDEPGAWYTLPGPLLWAYAGGGSLRRYGNAAEDIEASIAHGFKVIELDFAQTSDGVPAASHFFKPEDSDSEWDHIPSAAEFKAKKVNGKYTPLVFDDVMTRYRDGGVTFSLDPFYYHCHVRDGERVFRNYVIGHTTSDERKRIILQVYGFKTLCGLKGTRDFGALHYVIGPGNFWKVPSLVPVLTEVGVRSVSFQDEPFTDEMKRAVALLKKANIRVSVAGVNTLERYREVCTMGVDLVNSAVLTPKMIKEGAGCAC